MRELDADTSLESIAIISDIHSNSNSLSESLDIIRTMNIPKVIILGDLLSYGCDPNGVIEQLISLQNDRECIFVKGNHDQFYFDLESGKKSFAYSIPKFVSESIFWTANELNGIKLQSMFDWKKSFSMDPIYFAHANPFGYGDWRYVESPESCLEASIKLNKNGFKVGVFGHSHRSSAVKVTADNVISVINDNSISLDNHSTYILNPGSIGQPRGDGLSFMVISLNKNKLRLKFHSVDVDLNHSAYLINNSEMTLSTKEKLISYLGVNR